MFPFGILTGSWVSLQAKIETILTVIYRLCQESIIRILRNCLEGINGCSEANETDWHFRDRQGTFQRQNRNATTEISLMIQAVTCERYQSETSAFNPSIETVVGCCASVWNFSIFVCNFGSLKNTVLI